MTDHAKHDLVYPPKAGDGRLSISLLQCWISLDNFPRLCGLASRSERAINIFRQKLSGCTINALKQAFLPLLLSMV